MRHSDIIDRLEMVLIETEYALADHPTGERALGGEQQRQSALRRANTAMRLALLALKGDEAQRAPRDFEYRH